MRSIICSTVCLIGCVLANDAQNTLRAVDDLVQKADNILAASEKDFITAAKEAGIVFAAAHALLENADDLRAMQYFEKGLRLSPWNLEEQLAYAELQQSRGDTPSAAKTARIVMQRTESDDLARKAAQLLGSKSIPNPRSDGTPHNEPWLCFVRLGSVNDIVLADTTQRIGETLGLDAVVAEEVLVAQNSQVEG